MPNFGKVELAKMFFFSFTFKTRQLNLQKYSEKNKSASPQALTSNLANFIDALGIRKLTTLF
jgi:hypothetical protein